MRLDELFSLWLLKYKN